MDVGLSRDPAESFRPVEQTVDQNMKVLDWFIRTLPDRNYRVIRREALSDGPRTVKELGELGAGFVGNRIEPARFSPAAVKMASSSPSQMISSPVAYC